MIASVIGKTFLEAYNKKFQKNYTAKEFFVEEYFPLFFDGDKYMQWVTNSPFVQGLKKGCSPTHEERIAKLQTLIDNISTRDADASIAIGFPSIDDTATTSGQISNMTLPLSENDVYYSWIGGGLGVGVQSGLSLFFNNPSILLSIYDGWNIYRSFLNNIEKLRGNQINTWNGQWLSHCYNPRTYNANYPTASFDPFDSKKNGDIEIKTQSWVSVLLGIARNFPNTVETAYVYSLGQTNTTVGFIPFTLPKIRLPFELYEKYFGRTNHQLIESLFGTEIGFTKVCQFGSVGINALEPKGFKDCFVKGTIPSYKENNEEKKISYNTYQIWLLAMLNNEDLWNKAQDIATVLNTYARPEKKGEKKTSGKTDKRREVETVLSATNKKGFIDAITTLIKDSEDVNSLSEIGELVHLMPTDNVPYFLTLIRFRYAILSKL